MTKTKLAKLAARSEQNGNVLGDLAQQPLPDDFDPVAMLDEHLANCANNQQLSITSFRQPPVQPAPVLRETSDPDYVAFDSGIDLESALRSSLIGFNNDFYSTNPSAIGNNPGTAICAQSTVNGECVDFAKMQTDLPGVGWYEQQLAAAGEKAWYQPQAEKAAAPPSPLGYYPWAEVERHDRLEVEMDSWVDWDVYAKSPALAASAETADAMVSEQANTICATPAVGESGLPAGWPTELDLELLNALHGI